MIFGGMKTYHSSSPLVYNLDQANLVFLLEFVVSDRISILLPLNLICDPVNDFKTLLKFRCDMRLGLGFFDEYKDREESHCFLGRVVGQDVFEDQFGKDQFWG